MLGPARQDAPRGLRGRARGSAGANCRLALLLLLPASCWRNGKDSAGDMTRPLEEKRKSSGLHIASYSMIHGAVSPGQRCVCHKLRLATEECIIRFGTELVFQGQPMLCLLYLTVS